MDIISIMANTSDLLNLVGSKLTCSDILLLRVNFLFGSFVFNLRTIVKYKHIIKDKRLNERVAYILHMSTDGTFGSKMQIFAGQRMCERAKPGGSITFRH
jgi:hypothetical protein